MNRIHFSSTGARKQSSGLRFIRQNGSSVYPVLPEGNNYGEWLQRTRGDRLRLVHRHHLWALAALRLVAIAQPAGAPPLASIAGEVIYADGNPASYARIWWETATGIARNGSIQAGEDGRFELSLRVGGYHICAVPQIRTSGRFDPTPACFPSIPLRDRFSAAVVGTKPGERVGPIRITLGRERVYSINGRVVTKVPRSRSWNMSAWATSNRLRLDVESGISGPAYYKASINQKTGEFSIHGLPCGEYLILVEAGEPLECDTCPMPVRFRSTARIRVDHDLSGLVLKLLPNTSVSGRLIGDSTDQFASVGKQAVSLDGGLPSYLSGQPLYGTVSPNGLFHIDQVPPGEYSVHVRDELRYFVTVRHNGRTAPANILRIEPGSSPELEVTLRRATASILVTVEMELRNRPRSGLSVLAIPEDGWGDPDSWTGPEYLEEKGYIKLEVGRPGRYLVFATQNLSSHVIEAWSDELRRHAREATTVLVKDGSTAALTVRPVTLDATDVGPNPQPAK